MAPDLRLFLLYAAGVFYLFSCCILQDVHGASCVFLIDGSQQCFLTLQKIDVPSRSGQEQCHIPS